MISHLFLKTIKTLSASVNLEVNESGLEFLVIDHPKFDAAFTLHGGHLVHFQKKQQPAIIWLSKTAILDGTKAIRGGVPVCWPWFGAADASLGDNLPSHGFARTSTWSIGDINDSEDGVELELKLHSNAETLKLWPFEFELTLKASFDDSLKLELITQNLSNKALSYRSALHTYLNISAPESINVSGLNTEFSDSLNNNAMTTGDTTLAINKAIDSVYKKSQSNISIEDKQFERTLIMSNEGNDSEVVWSPWVEGAKAFADMPDDGYQTMLCVESSITNPNGEEVAAGAQHTLSTLIK